MSTREERSKFMRETDEYLHRIVQNDLAKYRQPFIASMLGDSQKKSSN